MYIFVLNLAISQRNTEGLNPFFAGAMGAIIKFCFVPAQKKYLQERLFIPISLEIRWFFHACGSGITRSDLHFLHRHKTFSKGKRLGFAPLK